MKFEQLIALIETLSHSQGFYGRLLETINSLDAWQLDKLKELWESKNFKDEIEFIMFLEGEE